MSTELPDQKTEQEISEPGYYPVTESPEGPLYLHNMPDLEKDKIFHFKKGKFKDEEEQHGFVLQKEIAGLHYIFYLGQAYDQYNLLFKTKEYGYATVDLSEDEQEVLWNTLSSFIESVGKAGYSVQEIIGSPIDAGYSSEEIEECLEEILASPKNTLTREEIKEEYNSYKIFELYRELFDKDFHGKHYNTKSRAKGRSRYFGIMFKKHMPDWTMEKESYSTDFVLKRKIKEQ